MPSATSASARGRDLLVTHADELGEEHDLAVIRRETREAGFQGLELLLRDQLAARRLEAQTSRATSRLEAR